MQITIEEIRNRTTPDAVSGCWVWSGGKDRDGYARWNAAEKEFGTRAAHRVAFFLANGYLPEWPIVVDHKCRNAACVNPDHLRPMERLTNAFRGDGDVRPETCPLGHNRWRIGPDNVRQCLDCRKIFKARYRARKKAGLVKSRSGLAT